MEHRKSGFRFGHACPAALSMAKSAEAANAGATQHSAKQRAQSARRLRRYPPEAGSAGWLPAASAGWLPAGSAGWGPAGSAGWLPAGNVSLLLA